MEGPTALAQFRSCPPVAISVSAVHSHALLSSQPCQSCQCLHTDESPTDQTYLPCAPKAEATV
ncbi:hypothetical protein CGMCC3_g2761 [Colletotrichum fructicola]|nr:uncharacterized protein CGMCC3_g2761 [Colletotrichum fructicola]KAE9581371.1 hypothetical protein CGMCC3_g2761 [Colletotrichum fructicola]